MFNFVVEWEMCVDNLVSSFYCWIENVCEWFLIKEEIDWLVKVLDFDED